MGFEIPVDVDYFEHPKTKRLIAEVGPEADIFPLRLWKWAAKYCKRGNLGPLTALAEQAAGWSGRGKPRNHLLFALLRCGFLDVLMPDSSLKQGRDAEETVRESIKIGGNGVCPGAIIIHDWEQGIGRAIALYDAKKRKQRERYAQIHGILPEEFQASSTHSGYSGNPGNSGGDTAPPPAAPPETPEPGPDVTPPDPAGTGSQQAPEGQDPAQPRQDAAHEAREIDRDIGAFGYCSFPGADAKRKAVEDLRRQGFTHKQIRAAAGAGNPSAAFYAVVRQLEKNGSNGTYAKIRENAPTERAPVLAERREAVQARQDEARKRADQILAEMDPDELHGWTVDAEAAAAKAGVPQGPPRAMYVQSALRKRAAETFKIQGV